MRQLPMATFLALSALMFLSACDKDDPVGPDGGVAGIWTVTAIEDATGCNEGTSTSTLTIRIEQAGNILTVTIDGATYSGNLNGTIGTWSGSYPDDGGTTSEEYLVTFANENTTMSGGSTWTWTDGASSCAGTVRVTGSR